MKDKRGSRKDERWRIKEEVVMIKKRLRIKGEG